MLSGIIAVALLLVAGAHSQGVDPTFCSFATTISPQIPFPIPGLLFDYQAKIEVNSELTKNTVEMDQYYDGIRNRAVTIYRTKDLEIRTYTYGDTNELIVISGDSCNIYKANETNGIGIGAINFNGTEHVISPLALLHYQNPDAKEIYIGEFVRRGIKVVAWQSCIYNEAIKGTQKRTYYLSNPIEWQVAVPVGNISTVPVEITVETKLQNGTQWQDTYVISQFRPGILVDREFWLTPRGVWCAGRQAGPKPPTVPKSFRFRSTIVSAFPNLGGLFGVTTSIRESYDFPRKLVRFDLVKNNNPLTEVHDFNTGLRYVIDKFRGNCTLTVLDPEYFDSDASSGTSIKLKDPQAFFNLDGPDVQYTGQRITQGVDTDVWIAKRVKNNVTATWEWYFMAQGWSHEGSLKWQQRELVQINVVFYELYLNNKTQQMDYVQVPITYLLSDYDDSGVDLYDYDVSSCTDQWPKKHFKFNLPTDYYDLMAANQVILQLAILVELEVNSLLSAMRISQLKVDFNKDSIFVIFTLLEKNSFYGPVEVKEEVLLDDAIKILNASIAAGKVKIPLPVDNVTILQIPILQNSFYEIETRQTVFVINKEIIKQTGYTSGTVAGISIVLMFVGVILGVLAGIFFCIYKPNSIPMDRLNKLAEGFTNINFKNSA
jgi:hypothetical protein